MLGLSERRACKIIGQCRSTQRYEPKPRVDEELVVVKLHELADLHKRRGYRHRPDLMGRQGIEVSDGRAWRLSRREGLQVPKKQKKARRRGTKDAASDRLAAEFGPRYDCTPFRETLERLDDLVGPAACV